MWKNKLMKYNFIVVFLLVSLVALFSLGIDIASAALVGNTNNATLTLSPDNGVYKVNGTFAVDILVNTHGQNAVVVAAYLNYNPSIIEVVSINTSSSVFTMEAENSIDSVNGRIKITRGVPTPGINTVNGKVATLNIRGKTDSIPSADNLTFDFTAGSTTDSNVIFNDGFGTDVLQGVYNARFSFDGTAPANVTNFSATPAANSVLLSWVNPVSDFNGVTILRKTSSYPLNSSDGTVVYDNNGTSYTDSGLTAGSVYYYTAFSRDIVLNYSSGANVSASLLDSAAPSAIANLIVSATSAKSVILNWTATGDDGNVGTASSYDIRYSTSTITVANWNSATSIASEPTPKASGNPETVTITGLNGGVTYYFAIRAIDKGANISTLSNIISFKTYVGTDLSRDYFVNSVDFGILMSNWGSALRPAADANQDGIVNSVDFGIMMSQWGNY